MKNILIAAILLVLTGCAASLQYTKPNLASLNPGSEIVVVYDYLAIKDDIGKLWDFDEDENHENIDYFGKLISDQLHSHGYVMSSKLLSSSGFTSSEELQVDYYVGGEKQDDPGILPKFWTTNNFSDEEIASIAKLYEKLTMNVAPMPVKEEGTSEFDELNFQHQLEELAIDDDSLVLVISFMKPSISFGKSFGAAFLGAALSGGISGGGYISYPVYYATPGSSAFLLHKGSGELLWKNSFPAVDRKQGEGNKLFIGFPSST